MVDNQYFMNRINMITQWVLLLLLIIGGGGLAFLLGLVLAYLIASRVV